MTRWHQRHQCVWRKPDTLLKVSLAVALGLSCHFDIRAQRQAGADAERAFRAAACGQIGEPLANATTVCVRDGDSVHCDSVALEPLDLRVPASCQNRSLSFEVATRVEVLWPAPGPVTVEWLSRPAEEGDRVIVVARREYAVPPSTLLVAPRSDRLLRVSWRGFAPITRASAQLIGTRGWTIPAPQNGAELVVLTSGSPVQPDSVEFQGPSLTGTYPLGEGMASFGPITPGHYSARSHYPSGYTSESREITVVDGASTVAVLPRSPVGSVLLTVDRDECSAVSTMIVRRNLSAGSTGFVGSGEEWQAAPMAECLWTIVGVPEGRYAASARNYQGSSAGTATFQVTARVTSDVRLRPTTSSVTGMISVNGRAISDSPVTIMSTGSGELMSVRTDLDGRYEASLASPGKYVFGIEHPIAGTPFRTATIGPGVNVFDWQISAASARVALAGWSGASDVRVQFSTGDHVVSSLIAVGSDGTIEQKGLQFGTYQVTAIESDTRATRTASMLDLSMDTPSATLVLRLESRQSRLVVTDASGSPVDVKIRGSGTPVREGVGVYSLGPLIPGSLIRMIGPSRFVPACALVPFDEDLRVTLVPGRPFSFELPTASASLAPALAGVTMLDNQLCEIPLSDFDMVRTMHDSQLPMYSIGNFPMDGSVLRLLGVRYAVGPDGRLSALP